MSIDEDISSARKKLFKRDCTIFNYQEKTMHTMKIRHALPSSPCTFPSFGFSRGFKHFICYKKPSSFFLPWASCFLQRTRWLILSACHTSPFVLYFLYSLRFLMDRLKIVSHRMMYEQDRIITREKTQNRSCPLSTPMVKLCHMITITIFSSFPAQLCFILPCSTGSLLTGEIRSH
jgi:hypothetical protein